MSCITLFVMYGTSFDEKNLKNSSQPLSSTKRLALWEPPVRPAAQYLHRVDDSGRGGLHERQGEGI